MAKPKLLFGVQHHSNMNCVIDHFKNESVTSFSPIRFFFIILNFLFNETKGLFTLNQHSAFLYLK